MTVWHTYQECDEAGEVLAVVSNDKDVAEVGQLCLDQTFDVGWRYVLAARRDNQLWEGRQATSLVSKSRLNWTEMKIGKSNFVQMTSTTHLWFYQWSRGSHLGRFSRCPPSAAIPRHQWPPLSSPHCSCIPWRHGGRSSKPSVWVVRVNKLLLRHNHCSQDTGIT